MFNITNLTRHSVPNLPWQKIKNTILGKRYNLSLVLAGRQRLRTLNKNYRRQNTAARTLAFPFSKNQGEIFLSINSKNEDLLFLFIHSLLHLKGFRHGPKMEAEEQKQFKKFSK
jgi:ssRNA-specific RNase YbeY (16S rRNA maturation enzyme)